MMICLWILSFLSILGAGVSEKQCEDPCYKCGGICSNTPTGTACKCADDRTGDNCDICLVRSSWWNAGNGYQYSYTEKESSYFDAEQLCKNYDGQLAIYGIRDPTVFPILAEKFPDAFAGLTDVAVEGQILWNDMMSVEKTWKSWGSNEPSNEFVDDDCGFLKNFFGSVLLSVVNCSLVAKGLCEVPIGCPAHIPTYKPKNNCEYAIVSPSTEDVAKRFCEELGGQLAVKAVNTGNVLKRLLHHFNSSGHIHGYDGVYTGFTKSGSMFDADGVPLALPSSAAQWKPGSPGSVPQECVIATLNPDWLNYAWVDDVACEEILPGLCEICEERKPLDLRTCKSGKVCPVHTICIVNERSCFEECICVDGYVRINESEPDCIKDKCIDYDCGSNASCVFDPVTNFVECKCDKGQLPYGKEGEGCYLPKCDPPCGSKAYCVVNPDTNINECICEDLYMPNATEVDGCILDRCASRNIVCESNASCCILNNVTKEQGCICDEGYYFEKDSATSCFAPCEKVAPTCGENAFCVVDIIAEPPEGHCMCYDGYLPNNTACEGCFLDRCEEEIVCGSNSTCCIVDEETKEQGCICDEGYYFKENSATECFAPCDVIPPCGDNAFCVADVGVEPPKGHCSCFDGYLPNKTACEGCFWDQCASGDIKCGNHATCCILDDDTKEQGCICDENYFFEENNKTSCFAPCEKVEPCGENAFCVVDLVQEPPEGHCICYDGYLPNNTACEECFLDKCANKEIICEDNASCCILDEETKEQGCICDEGYYFKENSNTSCFAPCDVEPPCGENAFCVVNVDVEPPKGNCICYNGYLPNTTACEGCFKDKCASGDIKCGDHATCCILNNATKEQGCICDENYFFEENSATSCFAPCETDEPCGKNAFCVVDLAVEPPEGHCICPDGYLPNNTACEGCFEDKCASNKIVCEDYASCCILDDETKEQGCICDEGYYFKENSVTSCFAPCDVEPPCGENAFCVVDVAVEPPKGHCICINGYLPNATACDGCVLDQCASGDIKCEDHATCCMLNETTKEQGCICDENYFFEENSKTSCFDPCEKVGPCGENAFCVVNLTEEPPEGHCVCYDGHLPNKTAGGCVLDKCASGDIKCGDNATCCMLDQDTKEQGCICDENFFFEENSKTSCFDPCEKVEPCGENAFCVVDTDEEPPEGHCICYHGHLPNTTACEGCVVDQCASGDIQCGNHATCCILAYATKEQGCICDENYFFEENSTTSCFDPCEEVSCQTNESCVVSSEGGHPSGRCVCDAGYMPEEVPNTGCIEDKCQSEVIMCGRNAYCAITKVKPLTQGCSCHDGFHFETTNFMNCASCPQSKYTFPAQSRFDYIRMDVTIPEISAVTVCAWVTPTGAGELLDGGLVSFATEEQPNAFTVLYEAANRHAVYFGSPIYRKVEFTITVSTTKYLCYVVSQPTDEVSLYVDGALQETKTPTSSLTPIPAGDVVLVIGQDQDSLGGNFQTSQAFKGEIDNLMLWYRVLTPENITSMYDNRCACASGIDYALTPDVVRLYGDVTATYEPCPAE